MSETVDPPRVARGTDPAPDTVLLELGGELDIVIVDTLKATVDELILTPARCAVVDASAVTFAESTTLGHLLRLARAFNGRDGRVSLIAPQPQVLRVLELMALTGVFTIVPSLDAALRPTGTSST